MPFLSKPGFVSFAGLIVATLPCGCASSNRDSVASQRERPGSDPSGSEQPTPPGAVTNSSLETSGEPAAPHDASVAPSRLFDAVVIPNRWGRLAVGMDGKALLTRLADDGATGLSEIAPNGDEPWVLPLSSSDFSPLGSTAEGVVVAGSFAGSQRLGTTVLESTINPVALWEDADSYGSDFLRGLPSADGVVALVDRNSETKWAVTFGGNGDQVITAGAVFSGGVIVAGTFTPHLVTETAELPAWAGDPQWFLSKVTQAGELEWLQGFPGARPERLAVCKDGFALVSGRGIGALDYDSHEFVQAVDPSGASAWQVTWPADVAEMGEIWCDDEGRFVTVVVGEREQVFVEGFFGQELPKEVALVEIDREGNLTWLKRFAGLTHLPHVALAGDRLGLTGTFDAPVDFGAGSYAPSSNHDFYFAEFTRDGTHRWSVTAGPNAGAYNVFPTDDGWLLDFGCDAELALGEPPTRVPGGEHLMWLRTR